jgi:hypothetical protein
MNDTVACPSCNRLLRIPADLTGQDVKCPSCQTRFQTEEEAPPPRPAPRRAEERDRRDPDDRPRRRRHDEEDEDHPRRRRRPDMADHRGVLILVLGLIGVFVAPIPCSPIAWYLGNCDLAEIRAGRMDPDGESMTQVGRVLGMIMTILTAVIILLVCLIWGIMIVAMGAMLA